MSSQHIELFKIMYWNKLANESWPEMWYQMLDQRLPPEGWTENENGKKVRPTTRIMGTMKLQSKLAQFLIGILHTRVLKTFLKYKKLMSCSSCW